MEGGGKKTTGRGSRKAKRRHMAGVRALKTEGGRSHRWAPQVARE